jgi:hypothetical protein
MLIDGRCNVCGRVFHGGVERQAFQFLAHECGGHKVGEEWRFDG